jgi:hypothetical protein
MKAALIAGSVALSVLNAPGAHAVGHELETYHAEITAKQGCDNGKDMSCYVIYLSGNIGQDAERFIQIIKDRNITRAVVILNSLGGFLDPSLAIAHTIREKGFTTFVASNVTCSSTCALIWLAGSTRFIQRNAHIGFHGIYTRDGDGNGHIYKDAKPVPSNSGNAKVGAYLGWLGFSYSAISQLVAAPPEGMLWLTKPEQAKELGIKLQTWVEK